MYKKKTFILIMLIFAMIISACNLSSPAEETPDIQATVDAGIAATATAQAELDAKIDEAVDESVDEAVKEIKEEYLIMTEEELDAAIDEAVTEATLATEQADTYATEATSDGAMTAEEVEQLEYYVYYADDLIYLADEMINAYYGLYAELANETIYLLEAVEEDLSTMGTAMTEVADLAVTAAETLAEGQEVRQETVNEILTTAQDSHDALENISADWETWATKNQEARDIRLDEVQNITANFIPSNRAETLSTTVDFANSVRTSLGDYSISHTELLNIAQLGANASAGLELYGGTELQGLVGSIGNITHQLTTGQTHNAIDSIGSFDLAIGQIPDLPSRPEFSPPSVPSVPSIPSIGGGRSGRNRP